MWKNAGVDIVQDVDPNAIYFFDNADAEDGILLNHAYVDMRGYSIADAEHVVAEEGELLDAIAASDGDGDFVDELIAQFYEDASELCGFDVGTAGSIYALSAAGAAPISSCNGGLLGEGGHSSQVPHVLFSIEPNVLDFLLTVAVEANVGMINNAGNVELFANSILSLHNFSKLLICKLKNRVQFGS